MMTRPRPPYLQTELTRHGKRKWYVRIKRGPRIAIEGEYGSPEFMAAYHAAISGTALPAPRSKSEQGSVAWAVALYKQSSVWLKLSSATRRQRENILKKIVAAAGDQPLGAITRAKVVQGREDRAATPFAARHFVEALRGLFAWALESQFVTEDPTQGVKLHKPKTEGFPPWTEEDVSAYRARWPRGTMQRVWLDVLLYTGVRRGDAVRLGRQHVKDGVFRLSTEKTGERIAVPVSDELQATLDAGPCGDLAWIVGEKGEPLTKESFGNYFREACNAAGVKKSAHGLRKTAAMLNALEGYTESELEAKFGWRGGRMASHYTKMMDREKLAIRAAEKAKERTSKPGPEKGEARTSKNNE